MQDTSIKIFLKGEKMFIELAKKRRSIKVYTKLNRSRGKGSSNHRISPASTLWQRDKALVLCCGER